MSVVSDPSREAGVILEPPGPSALAAGGGGSSARVIGVDVARGLALLGMIAVHIFNTLHGDNTPSKTHQVMAGHALATFVLLAGVSLTFITKRSRTGSLLSDAAALTTRALVITLIGLTLNSALDPDIDVILPYYGLMFLLAIPLLRRSSRVLIAITIGEKVAQVIIAETGGDMSRFPTAGHLASWAGLAPALHESAGRRTPVGTGHGNRWLCAMLVEAAGSVGRMHGRNYLAAQHARLMRRRGRGRAQVAVAHSILVSAYWMLKRDQPYHDLGADWHERRNDEAHTRRLVAQLEKLGHTVVLNPAA